MRELARVSSQMVVLFERVESTIKGDELCLGRPVDYYSGIMAENGFQLNARKNINIRISYYVCGAIRKGLNRKSRKEGEPLNKLSEFLQRLTLPLTSLLDKIFVSRKDVCKLEYVRIN